MTMVLTVAATNGYTFNGPQLQLLAGVEALSIMPNVVSEVGGDVEIFVSVDVQVPVVFCRFDDVVVVSKMVFPDRFVCTVPKMTIGYKKIYFSLFEDSQWISTNLTVQVAPFRQFAAFSPQLILVEGNTTVTVTGLVNLGDEVIPFCKFDNIE
eukprot:gene18740-23695_t